MQNDPDDTVRDPYTDQEYTTDQIEEREFGYDWLNRSEDERDVSLDQYNDAHCQDRYGDDSGSDADEN